MLACLLLCWAPTMPQAARPTTLGVPGRANGNVSMAARGSFVVVAWSASTADGTSTDVYAAVSRDGGQTFSVPARINATAGDARANGEQPPRIALVAKSSGDPDIAALWITRRGETTTLLTARSTDGGRSFRASTIVPDTAVDGNRGWQAMAAGADGSVYGVWLDHRRLAAHQAQMQKQAGAQHQHGGIDPELSDLYFARLDDRSSPKVVTAGVCYCCKTAILARPSGDVFLAWRHVYPGNLRDIAFAASRDHGRTFSDPVRVSEDQWAIAGCPDDGPAMAADGQSRVHVVWPTVITEGREMVKAIFHASTIDGRTFTARHRLPTQRQANHPQVTAGADGSLLAAWDESGGGTRRVVVARGTLGADGQMRFVRREMSTDEPAVYPVLTTLNGGTLLAWTSGDPSRSMIRVDRLK
jgi:hypothetical protein